MENRLEKLEDENQKQNETLIKIVTALEHLQQDYKNHMDEESKDRKKLVKALDRVNIMWYIFGTIGAFIGAGTLFMLEKLLDKLI